MKTKRHSILFFPLMTSQNARFAAEAMQREGILQSYHTKTAVIKGHVSQMLCIFPGLKMLRRRMYDTNMAPFLVSYWFDELAILLLKKLRLNIFFKNYCSSNNLFVRLDKKVAKYLYNHKDEVTAVYGFEDTSTFTFQMAKELGIPCIYELPIGYWRAKNIIMGRQYNLHPDWACTMGLSDEPKDKLYRKDKELSLADCIIVPSTFVLQTLKEYPNYNNLPHPFIIPYGGPNNVVNKIPNKRKEGKLRLLFCGGLTQRKGIADVFEVLEQVNDIAELSVIGNGKINECKPLRENLSKCNYLGVLSHDDVLVQMRNHDIMIFPSYFEGFALVIMEAMSQGLPVIASSVTSGPIQNGKDGWIVNSGDIKQMVSLISDLSNHRGEILKCANGAIETARSNTWERYQSDLLEVLKNQVNNYYSREI